MTNLRKSWKTDARTHHFLIISCGFFADFQILIRHFREIIALIILIGMRNINAVRFANRNQRNKKQGNVAFENFDLSIHHQPVFIDFPSFLSY